MWEATLWSVGGNSVADFAVLCGRQLRDLWEATPSPISPNFVELLKLRRSIGIGDASHRLRRLNN